MIHHEEVWGTVVALELYEESKSTSEIETVSKEAVSFLHEIDRDFSTFKVDSEISQIRRSELKIENASARVQLIWKLCEEARDLTEGAFDPWHARLGGFDPSGYVKGWAADQIANKAVAAGISHVHINAGGDITLRGGMLTSNGEKPWMIGIQHPEKKNAIATALPIKNGAVASSGTYERGAHIIDPANGLIAIGARATSVFGPDGGIADALATALVVSGREGARWFLKPELAEYGCWGVDRNTDSTWSLRWPERQTDPK